MTNGSFPLPSSVFHLTVYLPHLKNLEVFYSRCQVVAEGCSDGLLSWLKEI